MSSNTDKIIRYLVDFKFLNNSYEQ